MNTENMVMCVFALILGMLLADMLKNVCGCKVVEGQNCVIKTGKEDKNNCVFNKDDCKKHDSKCEWTDGCCNATN